MSSMAPRTPGDTAQALLCSLLLISLSKPSVLLSAPVPASSLKVPTIASGAQQLELGLLAMPAILSSPACLAPVIPQAKLLCWP